MSYTDKTDKTDKRSPASWPLRPLEEARQNPNPREQAYYGLAVTDAVQVYDGTRPPVRDTDLIGVAWPSSVQLDGPIPDAPIIRREFAKVPPDAPTMGERKRARLALQGIELPPPPEQLPTYGTGKNFTERAAIRKARNAAGILDEPAAIARREFMRRPTAGITPTVLTDL